MEWIKNNKWILIFFFLILIFSSWIRIKKINGTLPYIVHPDEPALTKPALNIIKTGDFNPHVFVYPSLPYYLTASLFVIGYLNSVSHEEIKNTKEIGRIAYPYYSQKRLVYPAKIFFAILSVTGMLLIGMTAYKYNLNPHLLYLPPLLLILSPLYLYYSTKYLNVDIIGTFFAVLSVFYIILKLENDSFLEKVVIPGILGGLALASKYNYSLILAPSALAILFYTKKQRLKKILLLFLVTLIIFFILVPYSLLDFNKFLDDIGFNIYHYKTGHKGFTTTPGWPQFLWYGKAMIDEYGLGFMALSILGIFYSLTLNLKKGLILLSFPLSMLIYMSSFRVHFLRNILAVYVFICLYCSLGILLIFKYLSLRLEKFRYLARARRFSNVLPALFVLIIIIGTLPRQKVIKAYNLEPDSRNKSISWVKSNIPPGSVILIPNELYLDTRELEKEYKIRFFDGLKVKSAYPKKLTRGYIFIPYYGYDPRKPKGKKKASRLNAFFGNLDKLTEFGQQPVLVNSPRTVPFGNPKFFIAKIRQSPSINENNGK